MSASCNVVFGRTGCGKTSLKNMLCGQDPEEDSLTSGTSEASVLDVSFDGKNYLYVDTAGILDNRGDGVDLKTSRADKVNKIGTLLKGRNLAVSRVFYCVAASERLLKEEIDWLADIIQMMGGKEVMQVFAVVLTKVDAGYQKTKFEKDFDNMSLVQVLKAAFPNAPIVTSGYDNVEHVKKLLVPSGESHALVVQPSSIKTIIPKADLETQLAHTQQQLAAVIKSIENKGSSKDQMQADIRILENELDDLAERIANASWWCPSREIDKAKARMSECKELIGDLRNNSNSSDADKARFEQKKAQLLKAVKEAEADLSEKKKLGSMFLSLLGVPAFVQNLL